MKENTTLKPALLYICTDGGARGNPGPAAIAYAVLDAQRRLIEKGAMTIGRATNNEAEYRALIWGLEHARKIVQKMIQATRSASFRDSEGVDPSDRRPASERPKGFSPPKNSPQIHICCFLDSELVVKQLNLAYKVRDPRMRELYAQALARAVEFGLGAVEYRNLPRTDPLIRRVDKLVNEALDREEGSRYNNPVGPGAGEPP